ncbi:hypothetical protein R80B4_02030 [Fibrobacteres bacterium R8-0-B4]
MSKHNPNLAPRPRPRVRSSLSAAAVVVWSVLWVWVFPVAAQGSGDMGNSQNPASANLTKLIPVGYRLFEEIRGDLNGDGVDDLAIIIKATDKKNIVYKDTRGENVDYNDRGIMVFFKNGNAYRLAFENRKCFSSEEEDGGSDYFAPMLGVTIKKGNLYIKYDHLRYGWWQYTFRYRNSEFELIGYDNSSGVAGAIDQENSINFLTKKQLVKVCAAGISKICCHTSLEYDADAGCNNVFNESWNNIAVKEPVLLRKIESFDEFDIYSYISKK